MSLTFLKGDIFESEANILVNPVNCVGVMAKGLALEFRKRWPKMYERYVEDCKAGLYVVGEVYLDDLQEPWIVNFPTKRHWRMKSQPRDIASGLFSLLKFIDYYEVKSLALPALGCGLGGLRWDVVRPLIEGYLGNDSLGCKVECYEPGEPA